MSGKPNEYLLRRRGAKDRPINPAVFGAIIGGCCAVCFALLIFAGAYTYSYTNDLRLELDEAKVAAADSVAAASAAAAHPAKRLGGGGNVTDVGGGDDIYGDDAFSIVLEMDEYMKRDRLHDIAMKVREEYKHARPYPSHVFDDIFPVRILRKITEEHPESALSNGCLPGIESCLKDSFEGQHLKSSINNEKNMGLFTKIFFGYIKGSSFVTFLEEISGIPSIIPDPHYVGAGLHFTSPGGKLDIHADFNAHVSHKLERRVNILIFLNEDWPSEYGGHLELWSKDMQRCSQKVTPKIGRMTVFSTTDYAYHGHPHALTAPHGRARRSIAMYYYTPQRPKDECLHQVCAFESDFKKFHSTLFQTPGCNQCEDPECNDLPSPNPFA